LRIGTDNLLFKTIKTDVKLAQKLIGSIHATFQAQAEVTKIKANFGRYLDREGMTLSWVLSGDKMMISMLKQALNVTKQQQNVRFMDSSTYMQILKWKLTYWSALIDKLNGNIQTGQLDDEQGSFLFSLFLPSISE
jgi:hypothetical protein